MADARRQQETCGYQGKESTSYPESMRRRISAETVLQTVLSPCEVNIIIACNTEEISKVLGEYIQAIVCTNVIGASLKKWLTCEQSV